MQYWNEIPIDAIYVWIGLAFFLYHAADLSLCIKAKYVLYTRKLWVDKNYMYKNYTFYFF